jgi:hypothetical protein
MRMISIDELARVTGGGSVTIPCDGQLPAPDTFRGNKQEQVGQAIAKYTTSPGFNIKEENSYLFSLRPGATQDHVNALCKIPDGRQYLSNMKSILG